MLNIKENAMNRVTKKFLIKLAPIAIGVVYTWIALEIGGMFEDPLHGIIAVGFLVIGPMIVYMLRETWLQAKREVEWENRELVDNIKDA
jgi:uncharacterized membrane protein